ncbi:DUF423 domain-containing protein [Lysobacter sp.]|uniref:DUF423 domain-containing protein n=1 Tax=Lysobacter sp. TaxID=72226 RepID=UPI002D4BA0A9|nr:DUF423 domain-containing protein [Lysobacter sp.]HZX76569.1 DUF423 domain-containing protein [Lysobacter sp.]
MSVHLHHAPLSARLLGAGGAILAAAAVALSAYAAHVAQGVDQSRLHSAALFAFGHGIALAALAPRRPRMLRTLALVVLLVGTLLFSGSLVLGVMVGMPTQLAPVGGMLMIAAWLVYAVEALRR